MKVPPASFKVDLISVCNLWKATSVLLLRMRNEALTACAAMVEGVGPWPRSGVVIAWLGFRV